MCWVWNIHALYYIFMVRLNRVYWKNLSWYLIVLYKVIWALSGTSKHFDLITVILPASMSSPNERCTRFMYISKVTFNILIGNMSEFSTSIVSPLCFAYWRRKGKNKEKLHYMDSITDIHSESTLLQLHPPQFNTLNWLHSPLMAD